MSTKFHEVCLALAAMWQADVDLSAVEVADGPQVNSEALNEWLFVGYNGDAPSADIPAVLGRQDLMAFARTKQEEPEVTCAVVVRSGDTDIVAVRARASEIFADAEDTLRADMTLGGLVMKAYVSEFQFIPAVTTSGAKGRLVFTVTYMAQL